MTVSNKLKEYYRAYYQKHKERLKEYARQYYQKHKEEIKRKKKKCNSKQCFLS